MAQVVGVRFKGAFDVDYAGTIYHFRTDDRELMKGDKVVVETQYGLAIGEVVGYHTSPASVNATRWVIERIDTEAAEDRAETREYKAQIKAAIVERAKVAQERKALRKLAKHDDVLADLLEVLEEIEEYED